MMGIVLIFMGVIGIWQGIMGKRFYRSGSDVGPWVKAPRWQGRLMFLAVGSVAIWKASRFCAEHRHPAGRRTFQARHGVAVAVRSVGGGAWTY